MTVVVITAPKEVVSLAEVKSFLRVDHGDDDLVITTFIAAATAWLDGPAGWLGRCLGVQELEYSGWFGCSRILLPLPPAVSVVSIVVGTDDGGDVVVDPATYTLRNGEIVVAPGSGWVSFPNHRIRYWAGYGRLTSGGNPEWINEGVPEPIRAAIMMLVAQWYRSPEPVAIGATAEVLPFAVSALLAPYRVYR